MMEKSEIDNWDATALINYCIDKGPECTAAAFGGKALWVRGALRRCVPFTLEIDAGMENAQFICCHFKPEDFPEPSRLHLGERIKVTGQFSSFTSGLEFQCIILENCRYISSATELARQILQDYITYAEQYQGVQGEVEAIDPRLLDLPSQNPN